MDAFIRAFGEYLQGVWGTLENKPFLGPRRDCKGIILITGPTERDSIGKITGRSRLIPNCESFGFNGYITKGLLAGRKDGGLVVRAGDLDMIVLRLVIAYEVVVKFFFGPTRGRICEIVVK